MIDVSMQCKIEDVCLNVKELSDVATVTETKENDYEQSSEELEISRVTLQSHKNHSKQTS